MEHKKDVDWGLCGAKYPAGGLFLVKNEQTMHRPTMYFVGVVQKHHQR